jgi:hypothetical protein
MDWPSLLIADPTYCFHILNLITRLCLLQTAGMFCNIDTRLGSLLALFKNMGFKGQFTSFSGRPLWRKLDRWLKLNQNRFYLKPPADTAKSAD